MGDWDSDERILIQGIIDAWFEEDDGLVLVDYKTDRGKKKAERIYFWTATRSSSSTTQRHLPRSPGKR